MPDIETREHEIDPGKEEDVIVKAGRFRLYFQNYYTIISLINDIFTGSLYLTGSILQLYFGLDFLGMNLFIAASFFLLMRPILKIIHNVHVYRQEEYRRKVLNEEKGDDEQEAGKKENEGDPDKPTKEVELKKDKKEEEERDKIQKEKAEGKNPKESVEQEDDSSEEKSDWKDWAESESDEAINRDYNEEYYGNNKADE